VIDQLGAVLLEVFEKSCFLIYFVLLIYLMESFSQNGYFLTAFVGILKYNYINLLNI